MKEQERQRWRVLLTYLPYLCASTGVVVVRENIPDVLAGLIRHVWLPRSCAGMVQSSCIMPGGTINQAIWFQHLQGVLAPVISQVHDQTGIELKCSADVLSIQIERQPGMAMPGNWSWEACHGNSAGTLTVKIVVINGNSLRIDWNTNTGLADPANLPLASTLLPLLSGEVTMHDQVHGLGTVLLQVDSHFQLGSLSWFRDGADERVPAIYPGQFRLQNGGGETAVRHPVAQWLMFSGAVVPMGDKMVAVAAPSFGMQQLLTNIDQTGWKIVDLSSPKKQAE